MATPPPGKGPSAPVPRGHGGDAPKVPEVFSPNADIRGGNVVTRNRPDPARLGRAPEGAPPQQPTAANHYMGMKGKADASKAQMERNKAAVAAAVAAKLKGKQ